MSNDNVATDVELAIAQCVDSMTLVQLREYANECMAEYYTGIASRKEIDTLLNEYPQTGE